MTAMSVYCVQATAVATLVGNLRVTSAVGSPRVSDFSADRAGAISSPGCFLLLAGSICWIGLAQAMISLSPGNVAVESIPRSPFESFGRVAVDGEERSPCVKEGSRALTG